MRRPKPRRRKLTPADYAAVLDLMPPGSPERRSLALMLAEKIIADIDTPK